MTHLSNDEFLTRLEELFASRKDKGSVFLLQKRLTYEPEASTSAAAGAPAEDVEMGEMGAPPRATQRTSDREWPILVRATDGKSQKDVKIKLATVVQPAAMDAFLESYSSLLRRTFVSALRPKRKRADQLRIRALRRLRRSAAKARARGLPVPSAEELEEQATREARAAAAGAAGAFRPVLPKVVGPRRGNGVQRRRRAEKRREKAVERVQSKVRKGGVQPGLA